METVWKYPIRVEELDPFSGKFTLNMPRGAVPLCVQMQHGTPTMWARVKDVRPMEKRGFAVVGTGHEMPKGSNRYIGTFQVHEVNEILAFHLFEIADIA